MPHYHAVVWMDHAEAKVFEFAGEMTERKHDPLAIRSARVSADGLTVTLETPELRPAMQMILKYELRSADGQELRGQVVNTIHALGK